MLYSLYAHPLFVAVVQEKSKERIDMKGRRKRSILCQNFWDSCREAEHYLLSYMGLLVGMRRHGMHTHTQAWTAGHVTGWKPLAGSPRPTRKATFTDACERADMTKM